ncbi:MAG: YjbQ family protein [Chloroflexi bacterium]|jgi:secondary thiamine-phosphate synthase enzyme|nr:YjbQ family protein [Chloroflexota bacterium]MBT7080903.1 YjbQ family protein [Chloroflexota bacterium]MBT7290342.1 YjbQ family protein [Chloroflexota bacterium]
MVESKTLQFSSQGNCDIIDITSQVGRAVHDSSVDSGTVTVFIIGSTAGVTTVEYESGLVGDLKKLFERIAPKNIPYGHDERWGDGNGHSHVRASLLGSSLVVPFEGKQLMLGTWQQIIVVDFDNRPRNRTVQLQIMGE